MKWKFLFALFIFQNSISNAQGSIDSLEGKMVRYEYVMDDDFIQNRKLIRHLDTIIPVIFKELANSRTCSGKCNADYKLELVILPPTVLRRDFSVIGTESYSHITTYTFPAYFILKNKDDSAIKYFDIIDSSTFFEYKTRHIINGGVDRIQVPYFVNITDPVNGMVTQQIRYRDGVSPRTPQSPAVYFANNRQDPTEKELFNEVGTALFALHIVTQVNKN